MVNVQDFQPRPDVNQGGLSVSGLKKLLSILEAIFVCQEQNGIFTLFLAAELLIVAWLLLNHVLSIANVLPYVNTFYEKVRDFSIFFTTSIRPVENSQYYAV